MIMVLAHEELLMNYPAKLVSISLVCLSVSACGDSDDMKKVKEHVIESIDSTRTLGTAMEKRTDCQNPQWSEEEDPSGRNLITFTCIIPAEKINTTFKRINDGYRQGFESQIPALHKSQEKMDINIANIERVAALIRAKEPEMSKLSRELSCKSYYEKTPEEESSDAAIDQQRATITNELTRQARDIMIDAEFDARNISERMINVIDKQCLGKDDDQKALLNTSLEELISRYKKSFNIEQSLANIQKNIDRFKQNPIDISDIKSQVVFSANPSLEKPVSVISIKYTFKNKENEYTSGGNVSLKDMFDGNELFKLRGNIGELYMRATGVPMLSYDKLRD